MARTKWKSVGIVDNDDMMKPHVLQQEVEVHGNTPQPNHRLVPVAELTDK